MQQARIYRAWFPSEIFWKYGNDVQREKTIACCMGIMWCCAKLEAIGNPRAKLSQIYDIASIFTQFCAYVRQLKKFSMDTKFRDFIVPWSIAALKFFKENISTNFGLIAVFVKVALEITKRVQHYVWLIHRFSWFFEISHVYLPLAEWVIKTFRKHPKSSKFVCIKSSLQFMQNLMIPQISSNRFLWNFA